MTVNVGLMQLPVTEDPDLVRTYLNGTDDSGGLWTLATRVSNHDHTGGLNGSQITAASIPDGSITTAKLDPSVLAPYVPLAGGNVMTGSLGPATTNTYNLGADANRYLTAFVGNVNLQGTVLFGTNTQPPTATLEYGGPQAVRVSNHLGIGMSFGAGLDSGIRSTYLSSGAGMYTRSGEETLQLAANTMVYGGPVNNAVNPGTGGLGGQATILRLYGGNYAQAGATAGMEVLTAPYAGAGVPQVFTSRLRLDRLGTLTLSPASGTVAVDVTGQTPATTATAGAATALPATPAGYLLLNVNGAQKKFPYYNP